MRFRDARRSAEGLQRLAAAQRLIDVVTVHVEIPTTRHSLGDSAGMGHYFTLLVSNSRDSAL
jgi:hypothetical protein